MVGVSKSRSLGRLRCAGSAVCGRCGVQEWQCAGSRCVALRSVEFAECGCRKVLGSRCVGIAEYWSCGAQGLRCVLHATFTLPEYERKYRSQTQLNK